MKSTKQDNIALLREWQKARNYSDDTMTWDGIIGQHAYWSGEPRIVFLLKEMARNDGFHEEIAGLPEDFAGYGPGGSSSVFWPNLASWKYALQSRIAQKDAATAGAEKAMSQPLVGIGYVDVKKTARTEDEGVFSNWSEIETYVRRDADFLRRQLSLMQPNVIFCCGWEQNGNSMYNMFKLIVPDLKPPVQLQDCVYLYDNSLAVIDWWHPSYLSADCKWQALDDRLKQPEVSAALAKMNLEKNIL